MRRASLRLISKSCLIADDVRPQQPGLAYGIRPVEGFADDLEVVSATDPSSESPTDQALVVGNEDPRVTAALPRGVRRGDS